MTFDQSDLEALALCAWKEARGEGTPGMCAVMCVIKNRVGAPGFGLTLHSVIYGKNQFSSMSIPSDPEFNLAPKPGDPQYSYCITQAPYILDGTIADTTNGAHFYENPKSAKSPWFEIHIVDDIVNHPFLVQIGSQRFYR